MRGALVLAAGVSVLAIGCAPSDEKVRAELRHQLVSRCATDIAPSAAKSPGFDSDHFCGCLADKALEGRDFGQVKQLFEDREKMVELARRAGLECRPVDTPAREDAGPAGPSAEEIAAREAAAREERERRERELKEREEREEREEARREAERARPKEEEPTVPVVTPPPTMRPTPTPGPTPPPTMRPTPTPTPPARTPPPPEPQRG